MPTFTHAIVRPPGRNFGDGLTSVQLGTPDYNLATDQHEAYCRALTSSGLSLVRLPADERYPDSTFVEDTAVVTERGAILTRPGAASRTGEVDSIQGVLADFFPSLERITDPATVDGGDVCEVDGHFFIGISQRTNQAGARQLADLLSDLDYSTSLIDIRNLSNILHLKSGLAYLGNRRLVLIEQLFNLDAFREYERIPVSPDEEYAANCLDLNDRVFVAAGFPAFEGQLRASGYETITLGMSEFRKMDGGLSCLSIRL